MKNPDNSPRLNSIAISVVVPVRDEEDSIRVLLEGLLGQTLPPNEIVITDGGSMDQTLDLSAASTYNPAFVTTFGGSVPAAEAALGA